VGGGSGISANTWTWVDYQNGSGTSKVNMDLTSGSHTVVLAGQAPSLMVDRLIFTTDTACVPTGTGDNCATAPATIAVSGVTNGGTVTGNVAVGASVTNATGVTKVDFYVDNTLYSTDTASPYCMVGTTATCGNYDTTVLSNGSHSFKATATYAGGTITDTATVTVSNSSPTTKVGDLNHDGSVNIFDLSILLSKWGTTDATSDLNHNNTVDVFDLSILLSKWGS
jgi:hypothetical protein